MQNIHSVLSSPTLFFLSVIKAVFSLSSNWCVWAVFHRVKRAFVTCWGSVQWHLGETCWKANCSQQKWRPGCRDAYMGYHGASGMNLRLISLTHFLYRNQEDPAKTACLCWQPFNNMAAVVSPHAFCHLAHWSFFAQLNWENLNLCRPLVRLRFFFFFFCCCYSNLSWFCLVGKITGSAHF